MSLWTSLNNRTGAGPPSHPCLLSLLWYADRSAAATVIVAATVVAATAAAPAPATAAAQDNNNQQNPEASAAAKAAETTTVIAPHHEVPPDRNGGRLIASPIPSYAERAFRFLICCLDSSKRADPLPHWNGSR